MGRRNVSAVVGVVVLCIGVCSIPTPEGIQKTEKASRKDRSQENEIDNIINGIVDLIENEKQPNINLSQSDILNHDEYTQNKVISHGMLVPMGALLNGNVTNVTNVSNLGNIVPLVTDDANNMPDAGQVGFDHVTDKQPNSTGKKKESGSTANNQTGNINLDDEGGKFTTEVTTNLHADILTTKSTSSIKTSTATTTTETKSKLSSTTTISTTSLTSSSTLSTHNEETKEKEEQRELCDAIPNNSILRNGLGSTGFTWPGGRIPFQIGDGFNETQIDTIKSAIAYYNKEFEGCLQWVEKSSESNYVTFENTGTCSSRIGVAFYPFPVSQSIYLGRCSHLEGHIKHEMMHTIGFYHEHSRSDRDMYIKILWNNIPPSYHAQFSTYRWTTGYGEPYDYESIMHYSSRAFVKDYKDKDMKSILPTDDTVNVDNLGFKPNLSETDIKKIKKMYKCDPFTEYKASCSNDGDCGLNEYCALFVGECRTKLPKGSLCVLDRECLNYCGGGVCSTCTEDTHCGDTQYCTYKYLPGIEKECTGYCGGLCFLSSQCGGECGTCSWSFQCE